MRVLICGANGQVGWELQRSATHGHDVIALDSRQLDITDKNSVIEAFEAHRPDLVINSAAYTAVDKAEEAKEAAYAVNAEGAGNIAELCASKNARLVHISTDFIFDGKQSFPYQPNDVANPLSVYGASKLAGEQQVRQHLGEEALIIRTAWVYSQHGNNFVKSMLRLMQERDKLGIVSDQIGTPTHAASLVRAIWESLVKDVKGTYHWTDAGVASWYDFAVAIYEEAGTLGILKKDIEIQPISTTDYPTPAIRPKFSVLDKTSAWADITKSFNHWRVELRDMLHAYNEWR